MKEFLFVSILLWCAQAEAGDGAGAGAAPRTPPRVVRTEAQLNTRASLTLEMYLLGGIPEEQKLNLARAQAAGAAAGRTPIRPMRKL